MGVKTVPADSIDRCPSGERLVGGPEDTLRRVLELSALGVWELDSLHGTMSWDTRCGELLGLAAEDTTYQDFLLAVDEDDRARIDLAVENALCSSSPVTIDIELRTSALSGGPHWIQLRAASSLRGGSVRLVGILGDVTAQKLEEERSRVLLHRAKEACTAAETGSRLRDERLQEVCHELRNPLHAVLGWLSVLMPEDGHLNPATLQAGVRVIARQTRAQLRLVEDLLDLSGMVRGKVSMSCAAFDIRNAIDAALRTVCWDARAKGVTLLATPDGCLGSVVGDEDRVIQILCNLLSNAIKFTPSGGTVEVGAFRCEHEVTLSVRDTGQGIAPRLVPMVFDRFWQGDPSCSTRAKRGFGLGLAIVRQLVELHGGTVRAASDGAGAGALFEVRLPCDYTAATTDGDGALQAAPKEIPPPLVDVVERLARGDSKSHDDSDAKDGRAPAWSPSHPIAGSGGRGPH